MILDWPVLIQTAAVTGVSIFVGWVAKTGGKKFREALASIATKEWVDGALAANSAALMIKINESMKEIAEQSTFNAKTEERLKRIEAALTPNHAPVTT